MEIGVRALRNHTRDVIAAVKSGEHVTLTVRGQAIADIVPHRERARWRSGASVRRQLARTSADPELSAELAESVGQTLEDL